jgi:integrase
MLMCADGKYSPGYISVMVSTVERFADYLGNPIALTRPPGRTNTVPITLTEAEIAIILHTTKNIREKAMLTTLAYSGIRNNEFCHLKVRDADIPNGLLRIEERKFNKQRTVAVTGECLAVLEEYIAGRKAKLEAQGKSLQPDDLLFVTNRHGYELESQDLRKIVHVAAKRAGHHAARLAAPDAPFAGHQHEQPGRSHADDPGPVGPRLHRIDHGVRASQPARPHRRLPPARAVVPVSAEGRSLPRRPCFSNCRELPYHLNPA